MDTKPVGFIYRIYCTLQYCSKSYIVQTRHSIQKRFAQHCCPGAKRKTYIDRAIAYLGKQHFCIEQLAEAQTLQQLNKLQIQYIEKYGSLFPGGFNISKGGTVPQFTYSGKPVVHYQTGIVYRNSQQAAQATGCNASDIRSIANKRIKSTKGNHFYWQFTALQAYLDFWNTPDKNGPKRIINVSTGQVFQSQIAVCRKYNLTKSQVSRMCLGKTASLKSCPYVFEFYQQ